MSHQWDPERYLVYADERGRPFVDLLARVGATDPGRVVDLGCGPGNLTVLLKERWPSADVSGVDSSPEMVRPAASVEGIRVEQGDVRTGRPEGPVDVLFSNATYQWVPGHLDLLPDLVGQVAPGGWFAFQVPGNRDEPSHVLLRELAADPPSRSTRRASRDRTRTTLRSTPTRCATSVSRSTPGRRPTCTC